MTLTVLLLVVILVLVLLLAALVQSHVRALAQIPAHTRAVVQTVAAAFQERQVIVHVHPQPTIPTLAASTATVRLAGLEEAERAGVDVAAAIRQAAAPTASAPEASPPAAETPPAAGEMAVAG